MASKARWLGVFKTKAEALGWLRAMRDYFGEGATFDGWEVVLP